MDHETPRMPPVVDRATHMAERAALMTREKAHTREGDAIAAARRRLPMVEVDATIEAVGPNGPVDPRRPIVQWPRLGAGHDDPLT